MRNTALIILKLVFNTKDLFFFLKNIKTAYINMGNSNYSRDILSKQDQTFQ